MVHLDCNGIVYCDEIDGHCQVCDFIGLWHSNAECGNCPLTNFGKQFLEAKFDGALWGETEELWTKTKEDVTSVTFGSQTTMD